MSALEDIYLKLPIALQHAACSWQGWQINRNRFGSAFESCLRDSEARTYLSTDEVRRYRDQRLLAFVRDAARTVPFYQRRFAQAHIRPEDIRAVEDLQHLPILSKEEAQERARELASNAVAPRDRLVTRTSGTTGGGLRFLTTPQAMQEQWATWWRYRRWHGIQLGDWCGHFGGQSVVPIAQTRPPFWRYNYPGKQIYFSAYHMSPANLPAYVQQLRRRRPTWLHGYPSLLALLAMYVSESGDGLGYPVRWVTIGAESLLPQQVDLIEKAFGVKPKQHYGMAEGVANISECELGALHVDEDYAAVEFLPCGDGASYKIVGTNFTNPATPLIRYDVQDVVTPSNLPCACGRPGRTVASIDGRMEDYVILENGARLGRMDHILKSMTNVREAQIVQERPGAITIRVVRGARYSDNDEIELLRAAHKRVGHDTEVTIQYVETLERSATGKLRFVVSEIPEAQLQRARA